jgi:hypothetical protein
MDPVAAIRPCEIDVTLGGSVYTIPALTAVDWMAAILGEPGGIVPGLLPYEDQLDIVDRIARGRLDLDEINEVWREALGAAAGRTWWSAARLIQSAADPDTWPAVHGKLFAQGVDLELVSIGALCNALYFMAVTGAEDEAERSRIKFELELPPPGETKKAFADPEIAAEDWLGALAQFQGLG